MSSAKIRKHAMRRVPGGLLGMELKKEFWDEFGLDLVIDGQNNVVFTQSGRDKYAPLLSKWGYCLASVRTVEDFKRIVRRCNACELEENNQKLAACLADPSVPEAEKDFIRKLLGPSFSAQVSHPTRARRKPAAAGGAAHSQGATAFPPQQTCTVVHADFRARKVLRRD